MKTRNRLVHHRFFEVAHQYPENVAIRCDISGGWRDITYAELSAQAVACIELLTARGIGAGEAVGLVACRHPQTIAAMIAVLAVGAHYIPLDPEYPESRLRLICDDASIKCVLAPAEHTSDAPLPVETVLIETVKVVAGTAAAAASNLPSVSEEAAAYVMFTSGSTGTPKGVVVPHRAIIRLIDRPNFMPLGQDTRFLHLAPLSFDASTLEIWAPLLNGGTCVLFPDRSLLTSDELARVLRSTGTNCLWLTASLFNNFVDKDLEILRGIRFLLTGGEALSVPHVLKALEGLPQTCLINGYGPTENTTFTTCYPIPRSLPRDTLRVPIGKAISGTETVIVDEAMQPVAPGVEGELIALGEGLALGYLNRPELTAERFVKIALDGEPQRLGYRTGDRVVAMADGAIDFLGRFDDQVKIDGHRIEPGEIQRAIESLDGIRSCRIVVKQSPTGQKRLIAYSIFSAGRSGKDLRERLAQILPAFMVPHYFVGVETYPTNANGKLDVAALPDPPDWLAANDTLPSDDDLVADAWVEVLGHRPVSDDTNFFDAGGTSLEAVQLHELLCRRLGRTLSSTFVFENSTIRKQKEALVTVPQQSNGSPNRGAMRRAAATRRARRS